MNRVKDKVALVTGGAMGLGKAQSLLLVKEGAKVALTDINEVEGRKVVDEIEKIGGTGIFVKQDVSKEDEWRATIEQILLAFDKLDILVNNAAITSSKNIEESTIEEWRRVMSVNLDGVFLGIKHGIGAMKKSGGGSIINMSSISGLIGVPHFPAYSTSKGGVKLLSKCAALHCAEFGYNIRVNSICPGFIWTPLTENYLKSRGGDVEAGRRELDNLHPIGHIGDPDDVAYGVLYLASDESKFITGIELVIDGGYTAK